MILSALLVVALAVPALAGDGGDALLRLERDVLGANTTADWREALRSGGSAVGQIGGEELPDTGDEVGGGAAVAETADEGGPANLGDKVKAGALSAVLPGAGQYYNDQKTKAYIMAGVEVGIWTAWFVFDSQGDGRSSDSHEYAAVYAGTGGSHPDSYWQAVGKYMDSDAYDDYLRREARATGVPATGLINGGADSWQWVNSDRKTEFQLLRADAQSAYDRRDFMILFAVVNRAVSVVDAVIGAGSKPGTLQTAVLGMDVELGMLPSWRDPGARCVVSRSF